MIWLADERVDRMDGDYLKSIVTIEMTMQDWSDPAEMTLGFPTSLSVHPVHVNQMDQALEVEYPDSCTVEMRHEMTNPVTYKGNRWIDCHEIDSYGECHIRISSELLSADEMIRMFDE